MNSKCIRVGVVGSTGYSGAVAARLLASHPHMELAFCTSDKRAGEWVEAELGVPTPQGLRYVPNSEATAHSVGCDAVILATSAEVSAHLAPGLRAQGGVVVDLSGAFRLEAEDYPRWYGFAHPAPADLLDAHYGLPELFGSAQGHTLIANPGCYPTASLLALAPLVREGLVACDDLVIDAKSGVTGAGRRHEEAYTFAEIDEDLRAYKLLTHQHTPEIERGLTRFRPSQVTFTPHLLPIKRGLLATCYAHPAAGVTEAHLHACLTEAYRTAPFVQVMPLSEVTLKSVVGTNHVRIGVASNAGRVVVVSVLDNLLKGASGQAIQNLNAVFGFDETTGLASLHRAHP